MIVKSVLFCSKNAENKEKDVCFQILYNISILVQTSINTSVSKVIKLLILVSIIPKQHQDKNQFCCHFVVISDTMIPLSTIVSLPPVQAHLQRQEVCEGR